MRTFYPGRFERHPSPSMNRRTYLASAGSLGILATAGCSALSTDKSLARPTESGDSPGHRYLSFRSDGDSVATFGVDGSVDGDHLHLSMALAHRDGTSVDAITLTVWMPEISRDTPADVALVSPVEGDSSPPPAVTLSTPERALGTRIEITDIDDLADETIRLAFLVEPPAPASELDVDVEIELSEGGLLDTDYTLSGELALDYPALATLG